MSCGFQIRCLALHLVIFGDPTPELADPARCGRHAQLLVNRLLARLGPRRFAHQHPPVLAPDHSSAPPAAPAASPNWPAPRPLAAAPGSPAPVGRPAPSRTGAPPPGAASSGRSGAGPTRSSAKGQISARSLGNQRDTSSPSRYFSRKRPIRCQTLSSRLVVLGFAGPPATSPRLAQPLRAELPDETRTPWSRERSGHHLRATEKCVQTLPASQASSTSPKVSSGQSLRFSFERPRRAFA